MRTRLKGKLTLLFMAFALVLAVPAVALADIVYNNVVSGGNDTITAGGSTTITYKIKNENENGGDTQNSCNPASDGSPAKVYINVPAGVTLAGADVQTDTQGKYLLFTDCEPVSKSAQFSSNVAGNYAITHNVVDSGTGRYINNADFTLKVNQASAPSDTTAPTSSHSLSSDANANGWHNQNVTVDLNATDNQGGSGVKELTYSASGAQVIPSTTVAAANLPAQVVVNQEGTTTISYSAKDNAGNTEQAKSVTINLDKTAPTVTPGDVVNTTWRNSSLSETFTASDSGSGLAADQGLDANNQFTLTASGESADADTPTTDSKTVSDLADNSTTRSVSALIDLTPPTVEVTGVVNGNTYTLGSVPTAGCDTQDALSGVKTNATLQLSGGPVGAITATCSGAEDNAGNTGSKSVTYSVFYNFSGFFRPVDNLGTFNSVKAGSAVPVKFSLNGNQGLNIFASGSPGSKRVSCDNTSVDAIEQTVTAGGSSLSYDATLDQYNYVWKTDKAWAGSCRQLEITLADGTTKSANFKFLK